MTAEPDPATRCRTALARAALADIPKLLTLQDRSPPSATFGCFDRAYWHYHIIDFPSGMSQEFVLPLALAWSLDLPDNPYRGQPEMRRWIEAGIRFAAHSAHADGSCDDYYPFERAAGAAAFSLLACLEASRIIGLTEDPEVDEFLKRRAAWLAEHQETGRLANHEALIVAILVRMVERFGGAWEKPMCERLGRLLGWQSEEGWFSEYDGADPGYLSLTIGLLADIDRRRPDLGLREPCARAIHFLGALVHPDGSIGGEYTSRATVNFFPHGLEIAGAWSLEALAINDRALRPLVAGVPPCFADDHIIGHHLWSRMLAWEEWRPPRPGALPLPTSTIDYPDARLCVNVHGETRLYYSWSRGGAFKLFDGDALLFSDTGPSLRTRDGRIAVTHLEGDAIVDRGDHHLRISGRMAWARTARLSPARSILLRIVMLTVGRFFPNLVRRLLQRLLVTGRSDAPFRYGRRFDWRDGAWWVTDEIIPDHDWSGVEAAGLGGFQTSTTTVMARVWQPAQFQPWEDLTGRIALLRGKEPLVVERRLDGEASL